MKTYTTQQGYLRPAWVEQAILDYQHRGQHIGCPTCMVFYLKHHANTCTYGKGKG